MTFPKPGPPPGGFRPGPPPSHPPAPPVSRPSAADEATGGIVGQAGHNVERAGHVVEQAGHVVEQTGHPAVDEVLRSLANAARLAPAEQIAEYEAAHQVLQETLASIDR